MTPAEPQARSATSHRAYGIALTSPESIQPLYKARPDSLLHHDSTVKVIPLLLLIPWLYQVLPLLECLLATEG
jgi:hypothetical protein